jgi:hypothetical protein
MGHIIGTDEAGYGPNFGPLVISASVWQAPDGISGEDLFDRLGGVIARSHIHARELPLPCMVVADSKELYKSGGDLRHLERGLWAAWALLGKRPRTWRETWQALDARADDEFSARPWFDRYDAPAPADAAAKDWFAHGPRLRDSILSEGVQFIALCSRAVFPHEFNRLLDKYESKGAMLSHLTLDLIARIISPLDGRPISIICDKHGGRNRYAQLLNEYFPDCLIEIRGETRQQSVYRLGPDGRQIEFCFRAKAETCLPAALASMASKYLRESAMRPFNDFWRARVPGLAPTAGYPQDARRFKTAIATVQRELSIDDDILWRVK